MKKLKKSTKLDRLVKYPGSVSAVAIACKTKPATPSTAHPKRKRERPTFLFIVRTSLILYYYNNGRSGRRMAPVSFHAMDAAPIHAGSTHGYPLSRSIYKLYEKVYDVKVIKHITQKA